jgi:hypothetical protein
VWTKLYASSGFLVVIGIWCPWHVNGGIPGNAWFWSALACVGLGTILRMEHWTSVALFLLVVGGVCTLATGAKLVIGTLVLSAPQASVLIALIAAATIVFGSGIYAHEFGQMRGGRLTSPRGASSGKLVVCKYKIVPRSKVYRIC